MMEPLELLATLIVSLFACIGGFSVVVWVVVLRHGVREIFEFQDRRHHDPHR